MPDMPDINFNCPHCSQNLEAPEDLAGETIPCPACEKEIRIPRPGPEKKPAASPAPAAKKKPQRAPSAATAAGGCPGCGAALVPNAVICIQCGLHLKTGEKLNTNLK